MLSALARPMLIPFGLVLLIALALTVLVVLGFCLLVARALTVRVVLGFGSGQRGHPLLCRGRVPPGRRHGSGGARATRAEPDQCSTHASERDPQDDNTHHSYEEQRAQPGSTRCAGGGIGWRQTRHGSTHYRFFGPIVERGVPALASLSTTFRSYSTVEFGNVL